MEKLSLAQMIEVAQKGCRVRLTDEKSAEKAMKDFDATLTVCGTKLTKKSLAGTTCTINTDRIEHLANCYNGIPESTWLAVHYNSTGKMVVDKVYRSRATDKSYYKLSDAAKAEAKRIIGIYE